MSIAACATRMPHLWDTVPGYLALAYIPIMLIPQAVKFHTQETGRPYSYLGLALFASAIWTATIQTFALHVEDFACCTNQSSGLCFATLLPFVLTLVLAVCFMAMFIVAVCVSSTSSRTYCSSDAGLWIGTTVTYMGIATVVGALLVVKFGPLPQGSILDQVLHYLTAVGLVAAWVVQGFAVRKSRSLGAVCARSMILVGLGMLAWNLYYLIHVKAPVARLMPFFASNFAMLFFIDGAYRKQKEDEGRIMEHPGIGEMIGELGRPLLDPAGSEGWDDYPSVTDLEGVWARGRGDDDGEGGDSDLLSAASFATDATEVYAGRLAQEELDREEASADRGGASGDVDEGRGGSVPSPSMKRAVVDHSVNARIN